MAKFDTSTIEGFAEMSDTDKLNALLGAEIPDRVDLSGYVKKDTFDKTASELADAKKAIRSKQTDEEAAKAQRDAEFADMKAKYEELMKTSTIDKYVARYSQRGYAADVAQKIAEAYYSGDHDTVFKLESEHDAALRVSIKEELMKNTPKPSGAGGSGESEPANVALAKKMGANAAKSASASESILKNYI